MGQVYHPWELWEDHRAGFYNSCAASKKDDLVKKVIQMFSSRSLTTKYMNRVVSEWIFSCEHNLSNASLNRVAYIGQAACCIYYKIPNTVTMEAWNLVKREDQDRADGIAEGVIKDWEQMSKQNQLCLNID